MNGRLVFNGIDARTGCYLATPDTEEEFALRIRDQPLSSAQLRQIQWWIERYGIDDPNRAPAQWVDPLSLRSAGWGVIFAPGITPEIEKALGPLLEHRRQAAGAFFRSYRFQSLQSKDEFLAFNRADPGPANPRKVPYYLLIVGSPEEIPFHFQYELDIQYAVGRIYFEDVSDYEAYARNVVDTETEQGVIGGALPSKQIAFFGVCTEGDEATERSTKDLIEPLASSLGKDYPDWSPQLFTRSQATKAQLTSLLGGREKPAVLLTASHGLEFPNNHPLQRSRQGALLCQDWAGLGQAPPTQQYFSGDDIPSDANLRGLITFHFACFSGGTPEVNNFADTSWGLPQPIAPKPFVSHLAQRLLGHPKGALAAVGHIDRAWNFSFNWSGSGQIGIFESTFQRLLEGHPIGSAMEYFNQRYAELSAAYTILCQIRDTLGKVNADEFARTFRANNDARNFVVFGDPAVKATYRTES